MQRKYRIEELIARKIVHESSTRSGVKEELSLVLQLSISQVEKIIGYKADSSSAITTDQLQLLASYFKVSSDELLNLNVAADV